MGLYFTGGFRSRGCWWSISDGFLQARVDFAGGMRFRGFWWSMCGSFQLLKVVFLRVEGVIEGPGLQVEYASYSDRTYICYFDVHYDNK